MRKMTSLIPQIAYLPVLLTVYKVSATGADHCFQHDQQDEMVHVTCTFHRNVTSEAVCPIIRQHPLFDMNVKSGAVSIVCFSNPTENFSFTELNKVGVCTCKESYSENSTCTLLLNTTHLERRRLVWKACNQQEINLKVENNNNNTSKLTQITSDLAAQDASFNYPEAVGGAIAFVAIVTIILVTVFLWMRQKRLRSQRTSRGREGHRLNDTTVSQPLTATCRWGITCIDVAADRASSLVYCGR